MLSSCVISISGKEAIISKYLDSKIVEVSSKRTKQVFFCVLCQFESKYRTVCINHIEKCITKLPNNDAAGDDEEVTGGAQGQVEVPGPVDSATCDEEVRSNILSAHPDTIDDCEKVLSQEITEEEELPDMFFNYKFRLMLIDLEKFVM